MKKYIYVMVLLLCSSLNAQDTYSRLMADFTAAYTSSNASGMKKAADELIKEFPDIYEGYAFKTFYYVSQNQLAQAAQTAKTMHMLNPVDIGTYSILSQLLFMQGRMEESRRYLEYALQLNVLDKTIDFHNDAALLSKSSGKSLSEWESWVNEIQQSGKYSTAKATDFSNCRARINAGEACENLLTAAANFTLYDPINPEIAWMSQFTNAVQLFGQGSYSRAQNLFTSFADNAFAKAELPLQHGLAHYYVAIMEENERNYEAALNRAKKSLNTFRQSNVPQVMEAQILNKKLTLETAAGHPDDAAQTANELLALANSLNSDYYRAVAYSNLGGQLIATSNPVDRAKGAGYLYDGMQAAKRCGDKSLEMELRSNYQIVLFQQGRKKEAIAEADIIYNYQLEQNNAEGAALTMNNTGFMLYMEKDYGNAARNFRKAVDLTEDQLAVATPQQRLGLMNEASSAYSGLVMSLSYLNDPVALFEVQELNRSRFLREQLGVSNKTVVITDAQKLLAADEILLMYSLTGPGELIINAITKEKARVVRSYPLDKFIALKKRYTDNAKNIPSNLLAYLQNANTDYVDGNLLVYTNKEQTYKAEDFERMVSWTRQALESNDAEYDDMQNAFLKQWYDFTIAPVLSDIAGKKKIIISPSGELNFLPFEAFIDARNKYVIEDYDVHYIPSVAVWQLVKNRNYAQDRKPIIAFGGATYQPAPDPDLEIRRISLDETMNVADRIHQKIKADNYNFKSELEEMGFGGANYLKGTLVEVDFLKTLSPDNLILTGDGMKESKLKQLDSSGELSKYRFIHLASHGFTTEIIPELSGVMMTQPNGGDGNQDMYLLSPEIARLNLKADMAVLSACSTGVGKLYKGEGFNGLNSAFMVAGANSTLLSLWPVNDTGTMLLMQNMYNDILKTDVTPSEAINRVKRSIAAGAAGDQFKDPYIWAPFLLNGR
jgi:CHAT domain-containing protein